jgi:hypothetical protein
MIVNKLAINSILPNPGIKILIKKYSKEKTPKAAKKRKPDFPEGYQENER